MSSQLLVVSPFVSFMVLGMFDRFEPFFAHLKALPYALVLISSEKHLHAAIFAVLISFK